MTRRPTAVDLLLVGLLGLISSACSNDQQDEPVVLAPDALASRVADAFRHTPVERAARLGSALRALQPENLEPVLEVYGEHMANLGDLELAPFFDAWVSFDPVAASAYADEIPHPWQARRARESVINSWASRDAIAARVAAEQIADEYLKDERDIYRALVRGWALSGQEGLEAYILSHSQSGVLILAALPEIYIREGPEGLTRWTEHFLEETSDRANRLRAFRMTVRTIGFRRPRSAIPFVLKHWGQDYATQGPRVLAEAWLRTDPEAGLKWLRTEAPKESRSEALGLVIGKWFHMDPSAARRWVASRPTGDPYYQPAFEKLAARIATQDPREAIDWCTRSGIEPPDYKCLRQVAVEWYRTDPASADTWMENESGLSAEDRLEVHERAARKKPWRRGKTGGRRAS
jgi:hypothetical protein